MLQTHNVHFQCFTTDKYYLSNWKVFQIIMISTPEKENKKMSHPTDQQAYYQHFLKSMKNYMSKGPTK